VPADGDVTCRWEASIAEACKVKLSLHCKVKNVNSNKDLIDTGRQNQGILPCFDGVAYSSKTPVLQGFLVIPGRRSRHPVIEIRLLREVKAMLVRRPLEINRILAGNFCG
jgi:hypothetical protein